MSVASEGPTFVRHLPPPALRPWVVWACGYRVPPTSTGVHRGVPSRNLTLVLELASPLRVTIGARSMAAHGMVGGLHLEPALIAASTPQDGVQYALTPASSVALFGMSAGELSGGVVSLTDLVAAGGAELVERLRSTLSWRERFALVDAALLRQLGLHQDRSRSQSSAEVAEAWRLIFERAGRIRLAGVADHVGWSRRHLSQSFRSRTGVTPKQAARIARFEVARGLLATGDRPLADVAVDAGYADQPHLAREWRAMVGCSVGAWLREELPNVQDSHHERAAHSVP